MLQYTTSQVAGILLRYCLESKRFKFRFWVLMRISPMWVAKEFEQCKLYGPQVRSTATRLTSWPCSRGKLTWLGRSWNVMDTQGLPLFSNLISRGHISSSIRALGSKSRSAESTSWCSSRYNTSKPFYSDVSSDKKVNIQIVHKYTFG